MAESDDLEKTADEILREQALKEKGEHLARQATKGLELAKYKAASYDRASTATFGVGFLTPAISFLYHTSSVALSHLERGFALLSCLVAAFILNIQGREALEKGFEQ